MKKFDLIFHDPFVYLQETFIAISEIRGLRYVPIGSLFGSYTIKNREVYNEV